MVIQDGFGDDTRDLDYEQYLLSNERLTKLKVGERLRNDDRARDIWDDCLQELRITQWQVLQKRPDARREYVSAAMSHRISEILARGTWTGMERTHGKPRDPLRRRDRDSVDDETLQLDQVADGADWVDGVIMAYHHGEIAEAMSALTFTQRVHVFSRIWLGMTDPEIAALQGCSRQTIERRWRTEIKPNLSGMLAHLA